MPGMSDRRWPHRPHRVRPSSRFGLFALLLMGAVVVVALGLSVPAVDPDPATRAELGGAPGEALSREEFFGDAAPPEMALPTREPVPPPSAVTEVSPVQEPTPQAPEHILPAGTAAAEVVRLTNAERAAAGCAPLRVDSQLTTAAQGHSEDMAARQYMAHESPEGVDPFDRARAAGYPALSGENVAMGQRTAAEVVEDWMNSEDHRRNIVNCDNVAIGVGVQDVHWTQKFGAE